MSARLRQAVVRRAKSECQDSALLRRSLFAPQLFALDPLLTFAVGSRYGSNAPRSGLSVSAGANGNERIANRLDALTSAWSMASTQHDAKSAAENLRTNESELKRSMSPPYGPAPPRAAGPAEDASGGHWDAWPSAYLSMLAIACSRAAGLTRKRPV
jgi:hypothetical protein